MSEDTSPGAFEELHRIGNELLAKGEQLAATLERERQDWDGLHIPAVAERNGEWATYCIACSAGAGGYVGCRNEPEGWPPPALIEK